MLRINRSLLAHFCPSGKSTVRKDVLMSLGYQFELFTQIFPFKNGTYYYCFDCGSLPLKDKGVKKMLILQKQGYMENQGFNPWDTLRNKTG